MLRRPKELRECRQTPADTERLDVLSRAKFGEADVRTKAIWNEAELVVIIRGAHGWTGTSIHPEIPLGQFTDLVLSVRNMRGHPNGFNVELMNGERYLTEGEKVWVELSSSESAPVEQTIPLHLTDAARVPHRSITSLSVTSSAPWKSKS